MRRSGTIIKWNEEKGYGFITPDDSSDDVFLHSKALVERQRRPAVGDKVYYNLSSDREKGPRADRVVLRTPALASAAIVPRLSPAHLPGTPLKFRPQSGALTRDAFSQRPQPPRTQRPIHTPATVRAVGVVVALLLPLMVIGTIWLAAASGFIPPWVAVLYVAMSAIAAATYALDKYRAQKAKWRISEGTLHLMEFAGGWPGAFAAQRILRHKNRKLSFQVTYWIIVASHLAFWGWFAANRSGWLPG